jgi:ferredoxin-NADP reductase
MQHIRNACTSPIAKRLFLDRQVEFWLGEIDPIESLDEIRARVVEVIHETDDVKTFVLQPNAAWLGHRAGQYVPVEVEIDGVRVRRCYSISSAPSDPLVSITVKKVHGGRVSTWLHTCVLPGNVLRLGQAAGDFTAPEGRLPELLLLSGGCGITPVMSIVRDLAHRDAIDDVVFVHYARSGSDVIFGEELADLAERHSGLRVHLCLDDAPQSPRGFDEEHFTRLVPDFAQRRTFLCGPAPLMTRVEEFWDGAGASEHLTREQFTSPVTLVSSVASGEPVRVRLARAGREVVAQGAGSLLEQLERAGERPAYGCRMGICHTCKCTKKRGAVQNLVTGEVSREPDEEIRLCVSTAQSDVELAL